jgi:hypothetical protein
MIQALNEGENLFNLGHIQGKFGSWLTKNQDYRSKAIKNIFEKCGTVN